MKELSGALLFYFYVLCIFLLAVSAFWSVAFGAEVPTIKIDRVSQVALFNLYANQFNVRVSVAGGNGGPRNYVGLFTSNQPGAAMVDWKYVDDTKNVSNTTRNLTAGTVTFSGLTLSTYEVRFYNWKTGKLPDDELLLRLMVSAPTYEVERRDLATEGKVTVTRVPIGNRDEVRISVGANGNEERIQMNRGVIFNNRAVTEAPSAAFASQP